MTITYFLLAQIAKEESRRGWWERIDDVLTLHDFRASVSRRRRERECAAKRRIVELHHKRDVSPSCAECGGYTATSDERRGIVHHGYAVPWPCPTLLALASAYANHADYDPAWRA